MNLYDSPIVNAVAAIPPELATLLLAALPFGELRVALPVALVVHKLPLWSALVLSIVGNMLPVYFLLVFFEHAFTLARRHSPLADRLLTKLVDRTRRKLHEQVKRHGVWALALFVAIPLPATGAWTGALAAYVFGLRKEHAFIAILLGVAGAAVLVAGATLGIGGLVNAFLAV